LLSLTGAMIRLFDQAIGQLTRGLEYTSRRHEVLTKNIANLETPGYRAQDLTFEDTLAPLKAQVVEVGSTSFSDAVTPGDQRTRLVYTQDSNPREDGNDVNLDRQMSRLAENTLFNHTLVQLLANRFNTMKQAISGRV
jgi:flagellar basal-body rod protein FlgB